jgi:CP family cyanate transporter-like MFS transporter
MAMANVLLPSLVKLHFPRRIGLVTALYTTGLAIGLTGALTLTVPISAAYGGWRVGLGAWAVVALVAAIPWLGLVAHDKHLESTPRTIRFGDVVRTRLGLAMACFFGLQSLQAYATFGWFAQLWRDNGYTAGQAGGLLGMLAAVSIPLSLWAPAAAARRDDQRGLLLAVMACYPLGYLGLMLAPHGLAIPSALLVGVGSVTFPIVLTLIGLRSRTPEGTAALSGLTQSLGYLLAAAGPFAVGAIYDATGGWTWPLTLMIVLIAPQIALGMYVARPAYIEDQLRGAGRTISDVAGSKPDRA